MVEQYFESGSKFYFLSAIIKYGISPPSAISRLVRGFVSYSSHASWSTASHSLDPMVYSDLHVRRCPNMGWLDGSPVPDGAFGVGE